MTDAAIQLIDAFAGLPATERNRVLIELVRISESDAGPIDADESSFAGTALFAMYDREEAENGARKH